MHNTLRKRIVSGLLAGLMIFSNVSTTISAADITFEEADIPEAEGISGDTDIQETEGSEDFEESFAGEEANSSEELEQSPEDTGNAGEDTEVSADGSEEEELFSSGEADAVNADEAGGESPEVNGEQNNTENTDTSDQELVTGVFRVSGTIKYNENLGGTDWSSLTRPAEFDQPIRVTQTYTDSKGEKQTAVFDVQDDLSGNDFYLKFSHDGNGGGDFTIENVPKTITDAYGKECQVTGCSVNVEPSLVYYQSTQPISVDMKNLSNISASIGTLTLSLKSQKLTLKPTVIPSDAADTPSFKMQASFTNPQLTDTDRKLELSCTAKKDSPAEVQVPLELTYNVTQSPADGYRLDSKYTTTTKADSGSSESNGYASGTIEEGTDVTITTVNYAQNVTVGFDVKWLDNNRATRPSLSEDNFCLQFKTADGEWQELTQDQYEALNISTAPTFDKSQASSGQYSYKGLPAVDASNKSVEYQVIVKSAPDGYSSSSEDNKENNRRTFIFDEQTSFSAQIVWNDESRKDSHRPESIDSLKLYRRVENGNYELVYDHDNFPKDAVQVAGDTTWSVNIPGIPRYNENNQEYDYVLVQGSIEENGTVTPDSVANYKTYYNNGSGSFGNDVALCHNNGKITEVLYDDVNFQAGKIWKDSGKTDERPDSTVTLWRYIKSAAEGIDDAYAKGLAAQVVFQTTDKDGNVKENIVSCKINKTENQSNIIFNAETVSGLAESYKFPAYDDQGREYVYFVRESLSGNNADNYEIQYTGTDENRETQTYTNGAPTNGTITNVRRQKAAVAITKVWQNPSGLEDIEGASVQLKIEASADDGKTYDELTVYSDTDNSYEILTGDKEKTAQTITGFTSSISQGEVMYYVNTYNKEGKPYDMTKAKISETVTKNGKTYDISTDKDGSQTITIDGQTYTVKSSYENQSALGNGIQQYRYKQTNTITAKRDYTLIKEWDSSIKDADYKNIKSVNFKLERRSTKDNADGTQSHYEEVEGTWKIDQPSAEESGALARTWTNVLKDLPRYDDEGYEYYYRATEISFTDKDDKTFTTSYAFNDSNKNWSSEHYRTPEQTKVRNYVYQPEGRGYFTLSKLWQDNGDSVESGSTRKNVEVRIYRRKDLAEALEKLKTDQTDIKDTDIVDFTVPELATLKYYRVTLTSKDQYTSSVYYAALEEAIDGKESGSTGNVSSDNWRDYIAVEYYVGDEDNDGAQPGQYTYAQLSQAAETENSKGCSFTGTVSNNMREYRTNISYDQSNEAGLILITNTRTGKTSINVNKTWNDDNNATKLRPSSVKFQLYRNGSSYTDIPDTVTVTVREKEDSDISDKGIALNLDHKTGIITVTGDSRNSWSFTIEGLSMFSSTAVPYAYNIDEVASEDDTDSTADTEGTGRKYSYIRKKATPKVVDDNKTQTYTFAFTNTITGTESHIAYKYWKDSGIGAGNRPDLYMNLYRYLKKEHTAAPDKALEKLASYKLYTDYKDQIWTAEPATAEDGSGDSSGTDYEKGYNWKITVNDLPRFDENGDEYGYVFKEVMNNGGKTVLGTYKSEAKTKTTGSSDTYEVFTNTISDYMTIQGKKTWTGLAGYQVKEDELPDPLLTLYRTTDPEVTDVQNKTDEEIKKLIEDNTITLVDTTHLTKETDGSGDKTRYSFPDTDVTDNERRNGLIVEVNEDGKKVPMLPKFDDQGKRYTYLVRETIADPIASQLYTRANTNGTLTNVFRRDLNRRHITVTKTWAGRDNLNENEKKYPSVTYTLYRYEATELGKSDAEMTTKTKIAEHTFNSNDFTGQNGEVSWTFKDLLIYSPTGVQYCYYIEEKSVNGYTVSYTDEDGIEKGTLKDKEILTGQTADGKTGKVTVTEDILTILKNNNRIDIISLPDKWNDDKATESELTTSVGTKNTYSETGSVSISGEKKWNDYGDMEGIRPSKITVTLTRHTNNESGQTNEVNPTEIMLVEKDTKDELITPPYIVWEKGTDKDTDTQNTNTWKYTIYNLERYAPNGMPYIYTVSETPVDGYKKAAPVSKQTDSDRITMAAMTNSFSRSYYVRKNWMDGNNKYNLRPSEITVKLQRSTDNGATWNDILWPEGTGTYNEADGKWTGLPSVITDENGKKIVSITLTSRNVIRNTRNNSWEYTFTNLPTQDKDQKPYQYRCVETAIGGVPVEQTVQEDQTSKYSAGAYEGKYTTQDKNKTVIENTLNSTSLVVIKQWDGDQENLYQSRPDKLTFILQKRGVKVKNETGKSETEESGGTEENNTEDLDSSSDSGLSDWENVLNADGTPYTFTITPDKDGKWTKTLEDLPTAEVYVDEKGQTYTVYSLYFRAVEVHTDDKKDNNGKIITYGTVVSGAQNYKDITDYKGDSKAHTYNQKKGCNESTITNELILDEPAKSVTVKKIWRRAANTEVTATFELLYKTKDETDWHCYGGQNLNKPSGTDEELTTGNDWTKHTEKANENGESCKLKTISSVATGSDNSVTWSDLPKYDRSGNELVYKVIEHPVDGYKTEITTDADSSSDAGTSTDADNTYATRYTFTNIELQSYTVRKIWQNADYAEKASDGNYTATFKLQQKTGENSDWTDVTSEMVKGYQPVTLSTKQVNGTEEYTWKNLPKYTADGAEITYRAVETEINGISVKNNTNGAYVASYSYGLYGETSDNSTDRSEPAFQDTLTTVTNRMIYGFVNLSKAAAYLAPGVTTSEGKKLAGIKFDIYKGEAGSIQSGAKPYVSDVITDRNGNLVNKKGLYGFEGKYLVSGTYTLKEKATLPEYSVWAKGITFKVGSGASDTGTSLGNTGFLDNTGEHGTAWISTETTASGSITLSLKVEYKEAVSETGTAVTDHTFNDSCKDSESGNAAVNLESRGVLTFTKTGPANSSGSGSGNIALDTHANAKGKNTAYFGVYLDEKCTEQVAGLVPKATVVNGSTDYTTMVLTDKAQDGTTTITDQTNDGKVPATENGVPYLRAYNNSSTDTDYPFTLLSGKYYIKELTPPAGYKLDTSIRKAVISRIETTDTDTGLSDVYPSNKAQIMDVNATTGTASYQWSNDPNVVTLYKMDQFGRQVPLKKNGYLELKIDGAGNTFPTGETTIRLYQDESKPAAKANGTALDNNFNYISYDVSKGAWTIKGLLDSDKTYTLSEPESSVHDNYIIGKSISFRMNKDGQISLTGAGDNGNSSDTVKNNDPLKAAGTDYENYYKADSTDNLIVMRDVSRHLKDIKLEKKDYSTGKAIPNISFRLYKYDSKNETTGEFVNRQDVLEKNIYLTTDEKGKIELNALDEKIKNRITGCALKYGLDIGKYYFEEVERGASDNYRLADKIYFEIKPDTSKTGEPVKDYDDYATVTYTTDKDHVVSDASDKKLVIVKNDPVTTTPKTLNLVKVDSTNQNQKLSGARFVLSYQSINHGHPGSATGDQTETGDQKTELTWNCITDSKGELYLTDKDGELPENTNSRVKPDISRKGSYTLKEIQAPDHYMTRTETGTDGTVTAVTMVTFDVNSANQIANIKYYNGAGNLAVGQNPEITRDNNGEALSLNIFVKNEKTKVSIAKRNDIETSTDAKTSNTKTCDQSSLNGEPLSGAELEIYEGVYEGTDEGTDTGNKKLRATLGNNQSEWNWNLPKGASENSNASLPEGTLKENTIYTLHESKTPTGYLTANDIYFKLSGTTMKDNTVVSQLYVWNGTGKPTSTEDGNWEKTAGLNDNILTMVDEAVIAPVDMQKVVGENGTCQILPGAIFEVKAGNTVLGTAISADNGYLVWNEIKTEGYNSKLIFNESGKRMTDADSDTVIGRTIILQQNEDGYTFTETYAPDNAHNEGKSFTVKITADNYKDYRQQKASGSGAQYNTTAYVDILAASKNNDTHTVSQLSKRPDKSGTVAANPLVNPPYKSTVTLHKYDGDEEGQRTAIPGTEFTLYRGTTVSDSNIYKEAYYYGGEKNTTGVFTTDTNGDISIEIHEKGTYILQETKAATGYQLDREKNTFKFKLTDDASASATDESIKSYGYGETNNLEIDSYGVPNQRLTGEVTLTKKDRETKESLNGVVYTLSRTDTPESAPEGSATEGTALSDYLLKTRVDVVTGKSYKAEKVNNTWKLTEITDSDQCKSGEIHISGLNWGTYTLTEKTELSGYKLELGDDGKAKNTHTFTINGRNNQLSFTYDDTNTKNSVTFYKTSVEDSEADLKEKPLAGAVFEVHEGDISGKCTENCKKVSFYTDNTSTSDTAKKTTVITGADGKVTIYGLPADTTSDTSKTYHLSEVTAPKGYKLQTTPVVFTIDRQGKVRIKNTSTSESQGSWKDTTPEGQVTMKDEPIKIYIQKLGEDDSTVLKGAEFELKDTCTDNKCDHKLADGSGSKKLTVTADTGKILIPVEHVIGGHTYTLTETKAPDGYERTAVVTFTVKTDGTIKDLKSEGGYKGTDENGGCASLYDNATTINIKNEKIRMSLTKTDFTKADKTLDGVTFTLQPYKATGENNSFTADYDNTELSYDSSTNTYTFTTDSNGKITFPDGLLKHDNSYVLKETQTKSGYYLSKEAKAGVILTVNKDGSIKITRQSEFKNNNLSSTSGTISSCPVTVESGSSDLIAKNMQAASFDLTKKVEGNMGDHNGTFKIKMEVYEPDGTKVGEQTVDLKQDETYDSETGLAGSGNPDSHAFGADTIPVGATLVITEENELDYSAVIRITSEKGSATVISDSSTAGNTARGTAKVRLNGTPKVSIELVNTKNVALDVGVDTEKQAPWAAVSLIIPAVWLAYRYRRKRRGGEA